MVAKISIGSSLYGALAYNQQKVDKEKGKVLLSNKMTEREDGSYDILTCLRDFENQMPQDIKTEKPVIHISINPHPDDVLTDEQLSAIGDEYMNRLGYGNQPYIIYKHSDLDREHIHIVSLRVDETGAKINDKFEHRRSKDITRDLEKKYGLRSAEKQKNLEVYQFKKVDPEAGDIKRQVGNVVSSIAKTYHFQSFKEYRTLLSLYNICAEQVKGEVGERAYSGIIYSATDDKGEKIGNPFKSSLFGKNVGYAAIENKCNTSAEVMTKNKSTDQTRIRIAQSMNSSKDLIGLKSELKKRGVNVVLRQNDSGRIYGVTFIDHNNHCVFNGSRLGKQFSANAITSWIENPHPIKLAMQQSTCTKAESTPTFNAPNDDTTALGGLFELPIEQHGQDYDEEEFRRLTQRKKKKKKQIKL